MGIICDGGAYSVVMVVSFAGVLDMAFACWKIGGGSTGNSSWVFANIVRYLWYPFQR